MPTAFTSSKMDCSLVSDLPEQSEAETSLPTDTRIQGRNHRDLITKAPDQVTDTDDESGDESTIRPEHITHRRRLQNAIFSKW